MENLSIEEKLKMLSVLDRDAQLRLRNDILVRKPSLLYPWYWKLSCVINVLVVTDGSLDFGPGGGGLSNLLTIFKELEDASISNLRYRVTIGHRRNLDLDLPAMQGGNPDIYRRFNRFKFNNPAHFSTSMYDQVWLFGRSSSYSNIGDDDHNYLMEADELTAIEAYMNNGGGLFATGDHGSIGHALCGSITRIQDMRFWDNASPEYDMSSARRNDTNQPSGPDYFSSSVSDQSDEIPQNIHPYFFGSDSDGYFPHPLLSCKPSLNPSKIIDRMPDHPHEGECKPETSFTVTNPKTGVEHTISTQHVAVSFVLGGNNAGSKTATEPHAFPSISVFDGRSANVGRIVIDSTWHHFVNLNLDGLNSTDLALIKQYYKNISNWMTRFKLMICWYRRFAVEAIFSERVMEAALQRPDAPISQIPDEEIFAIGQHAIHYVQEKLTPAEGIQFAQALLEPVMPEMTAMLDMWTPTKSNRTVSMVNQWVKPDALFAMSLGTAILNFRDEIGELNEPITQEMEHKILKVFDQGMKIGIDRVAGILEQNLKPWQNIREKVVPDNYVIQGQLTDKAGNPQAGLIIRAVDQDFTGENRLGVDAVSNDEGMYQIPYKQTDFVINGKESGGADIILRVYDPKGELLFTSDPYRDAPAETTIDLQF